MVHKVLRHSQSTGCVLMVPSHVSGHISDVGTGRSVERKRSGRFKITSRP